MKNEQAKKHRDRMVVGSGKVYSIKHYMKKFVSDMRQVGGFLRVLRFLSTNKTDHHDVTEILLKVALSTIQPACTEKFIFLSLIANWLNPESNRNQTNSTLYPLVSLP